MSKKAYKTVLVFGVFDILHDGHKHFLQEAKNHGSSLIIALTPDETIMQLKGHSPHHSFEERKNALLKTTIPDSVTKGDTISGSWNILEIVKPDIIVCGYDQKLLFKTLEDIQKKAEAPWKLLIAGDHRGDELHSSILSKHENS